MKNLIKALSALMTLILASCAHNKPTDETISPENAAKFNRKLVRESVVFEDGARDGAVVPNVSAPRLRAVIVPEHIENNRLSEKHREWILEGDVSLLGIPNEKPIQNGGKRK